MKISQKTPHTDPGTRDKQAKQKKCKSNKKNKEKQEETKSAKVKNEKDNEKTIARKKSLDNVEVKAETKKAQLEKRKQDEWKPSKKPDYKRLETVLEEGQLSGDEVSVKLNSNDEFSNVTGKESEPTLGLNNLEIKISTMYELIAEQSGFLKSEESSCKNENSDKFDLSDDNIQEGEQTKCNGIISSRNGLDISGMMEIFPIFSNDKFLCSRDAISIEESEDIEPLEKRFSLAGDIAKREKGIGAIEERLLETVGGPKVPSERKIRFKALTDRNVVQKTSSHFINSLLVLTPFAAERQKFLKEKKPVESVGLKKSNGVIQTSSSLRDDSVYELKPLLVISCTILVVLVIGLLFAWYTYQPPSLIDYILSFIPYLGRRRTCIQLFFDQLLKFISDVFGSTCRNTFSEHL